jgi:hypothetical protein
MIEYRIKPVTRYVITRFEAATDNADGTESGGSCEQRGEYANADTAYDVAYALCKLEHDKASAPVGSMDFIYPVHPERADFQISRNILVR